ncbi:cobalamin-5'-phosphate synthase [Mariprofundus ferrinatatus]|uniref:Adenosylcobinamide-GDP ribazoletransferase n=2 Tax=Mariprofundus ferrinatatus TaxID=1921087 RepID=A0A2K8L6H4_9PROT|nr:cobalamin-5'-phosphate synthase [Mariprofundus ferrinatatus]
MPRGLILAFGFLTRIPMPSLSGFRDEELSSSAIWFPLVGLTLGLLLVLATAAVSNAWLASLVALLVWIIITGGLHLDGASDLADALGAAHRDPERLLAVMKDPHTGSFGVVAIASILITKLVTMATLFEASANHLWPLLLIPAWARFGAIFWSQTLDAIAPGSGERFKWDLPESTLWGWGVVLFLATWLSMSLLFALACIAVLLLWRSFLTWRLGGMNGDCLGAGIEYSECLMLLAAGLL